MTDGERIAALEDEIKELKEMLRLVGGIFQRTLHAHSYGEYCHYEEVEYEVPELRSFQDAVSKLKAR